jgi:hypothetical protein
VALVAAVTVVKAATAKVAALVARLDMVVKLASLLVEASPLTLSKEVGSTLSA